MVDAMLDTRHEGDSYRRIEVITGQRRRRQWTAEEKARIVAESFEEGANISEVARRHGVVRGLLTVWRRNFASAAGVKAAGFVPVRIEADSGLGGADEAGNLPASPSARLAIAPRPTEPCSAIEIEVSGARIRVEPGVDPTTLSTVLSALRGAR
jgi:transposase